MMSIYIQKKIYTKKIAVNAKYQNVMNLKSDIPIENMMLDEYFLSFNIANIHKMAWEQILDTCVLYQKDDIDFEIENSTVKKIPTRLLILSYTYYAQGYYDMCEYLLTIVIDLIGSISTEDITEEPYLFLKRHKSLANRAYRESVRTLCMFDNHETRGLHRLCWETYKKTCSSEELHKVEYARTQRKKLYNE